jgi:hypothetical protein
MIVTEENYGPELVMGVTAVMMTGICKSLDFTPWDVDMAAVLAYL